MDGELQSGWRVLSPDQRSLALQKTPPRFIEVVSYLSATNLCCCKVHPKLLTKALMEASEAEVVVARVVGGQVDEGRVKGVELEDGRVLACDLAVLCMGPWTGEIHLKYLLFNEMTIPRARTGLVGSPWRWHWRKPGPQVDIFKGRSPQVELEYSLENIFQCDLPAATLPYD